MNTFTFSHLSDGVLLHVAAAQVAHNCSGIATHLAQLAEIDARKLYLPAAYPSMYAFCMGEWHFSEDVAYKHITVARTARQFPVLFAALAEGRLHLSGVLVLAPHLTPENLEELVAAATHKSRAEIELLLAKRLPRPDLPERLESLIASPIQERAPLSSEPVKDLQLAPGRVEPSTPARMEAPAPADQPSAPARILERARLTPRSAERYALQVTISQSAYEKLRHAQALLGHQIPPGEIAPVIERALEALIAQLEKRKFAATSRPRPRRPHSSAHPRYVPASVKRAVWQRDGGQCTFVSEGGRRCSERSALEFDHVDPVARGGEATIGGLRMRCRAHNQYAAERTFGSEFMSHKRQEAQRNRAAAARARAARPVDQLARGQSARARAS